MSDASPTPEEQPQVVPAGLPDAALVVRGGKVKAVGNVQSSARTNLREEGLLAVSVFASTELDVEGVVDAARSHGRYLPHGSIHASTARKVRDAGAELVYTPPPPGHYSLVFPEDSNSAYTAVMDAFDGPVPTPQGRMPNVPNAG